MIPLRQSLHFSRQPQLGVSIQDANRVGAQGARYPAMSVLYSVYTALLTGYQIGILRGARSSQLRDDYIKKTLNFKE
jgi:hypothetical protein